MDEWQLCDCIRREQGFVAGVKRDKSWKERDGTLWKVHDVMVKGSWLGEFLLNTLKWSCRWMGSFGRDFFRDGDRNIGIEETLSCRTNKCFPIFIKCSNELVDLLSQSKEMSRGTPLRKSDGMN